MKIVESLRIIVRSVLGVRRKNKMKFIHAVIGAVIVFILFKLFVGGFSSYWAGEFTQDLNKNKVPEPNIPNQINIQQQNTPQQNQQPNMAEVYREICVEGCSPAVYLSHMLNSDKTILSCACNNFGTKPQYDLNKKVWIVRN